MKYKIQHQQTLEFNELANHIFKFNIISRTNQQVNQIKTEIKHKTLDSLFALAEYKIQTDRSSNKTFIYIQQVVEKKTSTDLKSMNQLLHEYNTKKLKSEHEQ